MSRCLRPLAIAAALFAGPIALAGGTPSDVAGALGHFVADSADLTEAFGDTEPLPVSSRRAEIAAEQGPHLYAAAAIDGALARSARDLLPFLCRVALSRHKMVPLLQISPRHPHGEALIEATLEIAAAELRLVRVEHLRTADVGPWRAHACRIRKDDMVSLLTPERAAAHRARASYHLAKGLLSAGIAEGILELLQATRSEASIYRNAVALMVPLAAPSDPALADRLEREALDLDAIDDSDALMSYATFALTRGDWVRAGDAFERCLTIAPGQPVCSDGLETADAGAEAQARADAIDFMRRGDND